MAYMYTKKEICDMLDAGMTEDQIAETLTTAFNATVLEYREEQKKREKAEQERKAKAEAATQVRNDLIEALKKYLEFNNIEVKGDLEKWIKKVENKEMPFPFMNFFDLVF